MVLLDYISRNSFDKAYKNSSYDKHFVVATISEIRSSLKNLIKHKPRTLQNLDSIQKLNSPLQQSSRSFAPKTPNLVNLVPDNTQIQIKAIAPLSPPLNTLLPIVSPLTQPNRPFNPQLKTPIASQLPLINPKPQFAID